MSRLTDNDISDLLASGWVRGAERDTIEKTFIFNNFVGAFGWMTQVAIWAEKWNHHPEWSNIYKTVDVVLTTHDVNGLSELDVKLAKKMDALAAT